MKIDLHVHSRYSQRPALWLLKKIGCPESFTEPHHIYESCRARGMSAVTITDHNCIDGCLEIADRPQTFISEEVTTYFPEDRCKVHVLVYDISDLTHATLMRIRENIFDLVAYLQASRIRHALAHPLSAVNDRLTAEHFEKLLLLFKTLELNGDQDRRVNDCLRWMLDHLTPQRIEQLANRHDLEPNFPAPWKKHLISGSDDHSGLAIGRSCTESPGATSVEEFFQTIADGNARAHTKNASPQTMGHDVYAIAWRYCKDKFGLGRYEHKDVLLRFLDRALQAPHQSQNGFWSKLCYAWNRRRTGEADPAPASSMGELLRAEARRQIREDPRLMAIVEGVGTETAHPETLWFAFVNRVTNKTLLHFANTLLERLNRAHFFDIFHTLGSAGALYTLLAPYFVSFSMFTAERELSRRIAENFPEGSPPEDPHEHGPRVAHFTDTFYEVNGVARTLQQQVRSALRTRKALTIVTCHADRPEGADGIRNFIPIGTYDLPEYPEQKLFFPPFLEILDFCYSGNYTHIHSATPGPLGLAALAVARILKRPIYGTYHTALPQYAQVLTEDLSMEELMWKYMLWYYDQMDVVYVSSQASAQELEEKGLTPEKIRLFPRGVDTDRFQPAKRCDLLEVRYRVPTCTRLLYVGRVSKEKNLPLLVDAWRDLLELESHIHLVVVGDGPYLEEMRTCLAGTPTTFTGYLQGDVLPAVYASCDLFVFPSTTDTFGNVVLEAQACGLPVVVSDRGGPKETMVPGVTGLVVPGNDREAFVHAVAGLLRDKTKRQGMGVEARQHAEASSFDAAYEATWRMYEADGPTAPPTTPGPLERLVQKPQAVAAAL